MSSATMTERTGYTGMGVPGFAMPSVTAPTGMPVGANWLAVPRCTFKVEKCTGGFKLTCVCEDKTGAAMVQQLCAMLAGGLCSCCCMLNGMTVCYCNFTMCLCRYENTADGVCVTCTSGDPACGSMVQACCDCLSALMTAGCTCCLLVNNTPVCCGTATAEAPPKGKGSR
jgi:hypothetical protein